MKDYADRSWTTNVKGSNEHGGWVAFGFVMLMLLVGSSDIIERLLS